MIRTNYLIFSVLFSSAIIYSADRWEAPALGSPEEQEILEKADQITGTVHHDHQYGILLNKFVDQHRQLIQAEIKNKIDERVELLKQAGYNAFVPPQSYVYKEIECQSDAQNKKSQRSQGFLGGLFGTRSSPNKIQLLEYKNCDEKTCGELPNRELLHVGIVTRIHLYANLYNALSKKAAKECDCPYHCKGQSICYLSALQAELLVGVCRELAPSLVLEKNVIDKAEAEAKSMAEGREKIIPSDRATKEKSMYSETAPKTQGQEYLSKMVQIHGVLTQQTQEDLQNPDLWKEPVPVNSTENCVEHMLVLDSFNGPFVPQYDRSPRHYIARDLTAHRLNGQGYLPADGNYAVSARRVEVDHKIGAKFPEKKEIILTDDILGYKVSVVLPHIGGEFNNSFNVTAHDWISNTDTNRCVFSYTHRYCEGTGDQVVWYNKSGIAAVDLPSWKDRVYGIEFKRESFYDPSISDWRQQDVIKKGLRKRKFSLKPDDYVCIETAVPVTAVAYDATRKTVLYACGKELKSVPVQKEKTLHNDRFTFTVDIKKVFVTQDGHWFVFVLGHSNGHGGKLYHIVPEKSTAQQVLSVTNAIDIAFDQATNNFAVLTKDGVYLCPLSIENLSRKKKIKHPKFDYATSKYNAIDFQNGQIYVMHKPEPNDRDGSMLIYQSLDDRWLEKTKNILRAGLEGGYTDDSACSTASTSTNAATSSSSASSSSTLNQFVPDIAATIEDPAKRAAYVRMMQNASANSVPEQDYDTDGPSDEDSNDSDSDEDSNDSNKQLSIKERGWLKRKEDLQYANKHVKERFSKYSEDDLREMNDMQFYTIFNQANREYFDNCNC